MERWASYIYESLRNEEFIVKIFSIGPISNSPLDFSIDADVERISLITAIMEVFNKDNHFILTALTKLNLLFSLVGLFSSVNVITSVHLSLGKKKNELLFKYFLRIVIHFFIVLFSHKVICVSKGVKNELKNIFSSKKIFVLYNPCFRIQDIKGTTNPLFSSDGSIQFVSAGRLHSQKQFDLMIKCFALSCNSMPRNSSLTIFGDGELFEKLNQLIINLGVLNNVHLKPFTPDFFLELKKYNVFLLTSEYEGFGNVLVEGLAAGLNCISFNIPHGPFEILDGGKYGILIDPSLDKLTSTLSSLGENSFPIYSNRNLVNHLKQFTDIGFKDSFILNILRDS